MIQKIMPKISTIQTVRSKLKPANSKLKILAGSGMSGGYPPNYKPTEMIIPGGLDFKEKAYFLLTGKMPQSVMNRWVPNNGENILNDGDQLITANISGRYVGGIVDTPHDYSQDSSLIDDISNDYDCSLDLTDGDELF